MITKGKKREKSITYLQLSTFHNYITAKNSRAIAESGLFYKNVIIINT